jgi:hypothetical protein
MGLLLRRLLASERGQAPLPPSGGSACDGFRLIANRRNDLQARGLAVYVFKNAESALSIGLQAIFICRSIAGGACGASGICPDARFTFSSSHLYN